MPTSVDEELHGFADLWWLVMLFGVAVLGVGIFFVASPHETLGTFTVIAGILLIFGVWLIVAGVVRFVAAVAEPEGRAGSIAIAILDVVAGIVILSVPGPSLATLAVIIGIVLIFRGALWIGAGWELRGLGHKVDSELRARPAT